MRGQWHLLVLKMLLAATTQPSWQPYNLPGDISSVRQRSCTASLALCMRRFLSRCHVEPLQFMLLLNVFGFMYDRVCYRVCYIITLSSCAEIDNTYNIKAYQVTLYHITFIVHIACSVVLYCMTIFDYRYIPLEHTSTILY